MVRFAHMADLHLGGWRDPLLRECGKDAFTMVVDRILEGGFDFVVIAGDFFNTAVPSIDTMERAVIELSRLRDAGLSVYAIAGSHDYSASGKTMIDVLAGAGLLIDVARAYDDGVRIMLEFTIHDASGVKLAGIPGKKGALERQFYDRLDYDAARDEPGVKIFLFHMLLSEFRRNDAIEAVSTSVLPEGFAYYAGGHPHLVESRRYGEGIIGYPGPLFPNNFEELETLGNGGFYEVDIGAMRTRWIPLVTRKVVSRMIPCDGASGEEVSLRAIDALGDVKDAIVLVRFSGELSSSVAQVRWNDIYRAAMDGGAYAYLKNTYALRSAQRQERKVDARLDEGEIIAQFSHEVPWEDGIHRLMRTFSTEKLEGESKHDFQSRIISSFSSEFDEDLSPSS